MPGSRKSPVKKKIRKTSPRRRLRKTSPKRRSNAPKKPTKPPKPSKEKVQAALRRASERKTSARRPVPSARRPVPSARRPVPSARRPVPSPRRPLQRRIPQFIQVPGGDLVPFSRQRAVRYAQEGFPVVYSPDESFFMLTDLENEDSPYAGPLGRGSHYHTYIKLPDGKMTVYNREQVAAYARMGCVLEKFYGDDLGYKTYKLKYIEE